MTRRPDGPLPAGAAVVCVALTQDAAAATRALAGAGAWAALEGDGPGLASVLSGFDGPVGLVGVAAGEGPAPLSWLRRVAGDWLRGSPGAPAVLVWPAAVRPRDGRPGADARGWRPVTGREAPLRSEAWEGLPGFRHHLLLCAGVRCKAQGSDAVAAAVADELTARGAHDHDVLVTRTLCQFPCNNAPVVSIYPDNVWLRRVSPGDARALIARLLEEPDPPGQPERLPRGATR
ncbi:(2Fe-2S) ferredoxin domain-containing protein [Propioniciclava coleopterorum]|uniref:(2Fe-2S) ferredoxin domain-containing protein n=1 Tax=Propioniciclava coleopterorum TaxID=2714937 RepID=A0A6G7YAL9_9ACTN|nr:(2Fe-2S) ferredoxin domain-containing protein [Propioniciclava coleopterorum]QIK73657.1 (2Fe-2S) ferredoxin domain-containing protein [Propioniciclava coleopterorum]